MHTHAGRHQILVGRMNVMSCDTVISSSIKLIKNLFIYKGNIRVCKYLNLIVPKQFVADFLAFQLTPQPQPPHPLPPTRPSFLDDFQFVSWIIIMHERRRVVGV